MRAMPIIAALAAASLFACDRPNDGSASARIGRAAEAGPAAGLWRQRVADSRGVVETRYCLDAAAARTLINLDAQLSGGCARLEETRSADGSWRFVTECAGAGGRLRTKGSLRGDFRTRYLVEAESHDWRGGAHRMRAEVVRLGACPASMRPGDLILPGGRRTTIAAITGPA